jgi:hypothetical protein
MDLRDGFATNLRLSSGIFLIHLSAGANGMARTHLGLLVHLRQPAGIPIIGAVTYLAPYHD